MAAEIVAEFVQAPSTAPLDTTNKDNLVEVAENYGNVVMVLPQRRLKEMIKSTVIMGLVEQRLLLMLSAFAESPSTERPSGFGLFFKEEKALLAYRWEMELEQLCLIQEAEASRQNMEKMHLDMDIEQQRLDLIREGKMPGKK